MKYLLKFFVLILLPVLLSQEIAAQQFTAIALGCNGGITDGNLSAWLVKPQGGNHFVCLDAGTLANGIEKAVNAGLIPEASAADSITPLEWMFRYGIEGYLISHPHFDHIAGLIAASPDDRPKPLYASASTLDLLNMHIFNNVMWANFTDRGTEPRIGRYSLHELPVAESVPIDSNGLTVKMFPLSHAGMTSSAFLIQRNSRYMLYMGDTGADEKEKSDHLQKLWQDIAPLIAEEKLEMVIVEVSYPDPRPDALLFGHLTPSLLAGEVKKLTRLVSGQEAAEKLGKVLFVITHVKPVGGKPNTLLIGKQLEAMHIPGFRFIMARQGESYFNPLFKTSDATPDN